MEKQELRNRQAELISSLIQEVGSSTVDLIDELVEISESIGEKA